MLNQLFHSPILIWLSGGLAGIDGQLTQAFNSLAGRSRLFDSVVSLPLHNDFVKAAIIGSCFFAVWYGQSTLAETQRVRKLLLTTLVAAILVIAISKTISHAVFLPRPFILSQRVYQLDDDRLVENRRISYRVPLDRANQEMYRDLLTGRVQTDDFGTFPSDHAGLFVAISLGIWLASRLIGSIALAWTCLTIFGSKLITGQHTPLDIVAGAALAIVVLSVCQYLAQRWFRGLLERASLWTLKHGALSSALLFAVIFEVSSTFIHLRTILEALEKYVR